MLGCTLVVLLAAVALSNGGEVQKNNLQLPSDALENREMVKSIFNVSYTAYRWVVLRVCPPALSELAQDICMGP